ncbi:uncharacterized protein LOC116225586 [Phasianus colchicus]|uniref:uncharacterized protein LOC116225586 n=1 Tax=Phasianus colchicus TaxID=9054 RepID=UPI00129E5B65|nr:uncharacterized protein LOC116225586 [Phasianus colchicus]
MHPTGFGFSLGVKRQNTNSAAKTNDVITNPITHAKKSHFRQGNIRDGLSRRRSPDERRGGRRRSGGPCGSPAPRRRHRSARAQRGPPGAEGGPQPPPPCPAPPYLSSEAEEEEAAAAGAPLRAGGGETAPTGSGETPRRGPALPGAQRSRSARPRCPAVRRAAFRSRAAPSAAPSRGAARHSALLSSSPQSAAARLPAPPPGFQPLLPACTAPPAGRRRHRSEPDGALSAPPRSAALNNARVLTDGEAVTAEQRSGTAGPERPLGRISSTQERKKQHETMSQTRKKDVRQESNKRLLDSAVRPAGKKELWDSKQRLEMSGSAKGTQNAARCIPPELSKPSDTAPRLKQPLKPGRMGNGAEIEHE